MSTRFSNLYGCTVLLFLLFGPGVLVFYFSRSLIWLFAMPFATMLLVFVLAILATFRPKRNLTPEQFADELERRLHKLEGAMNSDDVLSISVADERLEQILWRLRELDFAPKEKQKEELKSAIAAIRRGELPEVVAPKLLTYRDR
jgi:hypothetical protein